MKVMTARVVDGKIDVGDMELEEGAVVGILMTDDSEVVLSEEDQEELELALAEIEAGHWVDGDELLREIKALTRS